MEKSPDPILFYDALSPDEWVALKAQLADDPDRMRALRCWQQVRAAARRRLERDVPDRRLLALRALVESGRADALTDAEKKKLRAARAGLDRAVEAHPSLADVLEDLGVACAEFEQVWAKHTHDEKANPAPPRRAADRAPRSAPQRSSWARAAQGWAWRVGVGAALLAFASLAFFLFQRDHHRIIVAATSGVQQVELADGTTVRLLEGGRLSYVAPEALTLFDRNARLEGDAFFDVAPSQRGFRVETAVGRITVVGTRFGVQAAPEATEVTLVAGKLALAPSDAPQAQVVLAPGQRSRVARGARPTAPAAVDLTEALAWTGLLVFRDTPARTIAARLSDEYDAPVSVTPALQDEPVTGTFEAAQPLADVLAVLAATLGAEVHAEADGGYRLALAPSP